MFRKDSFLVFCFFLLFAAGCSEGTPEQTVDFSRTIDIQKTHDSPKDNEVLRVAIAAMVSPKATLSYYQRILQFIGDGIDREIRLIQRKTYAEINELLALGEIDVAFICSGPYATDKDKGIFLALATPVVRGEPFYRSYLLVNRHSELNTLKDLQGRTFAFTDPDSNTGTLVPLFWLRQMETDPDTFFAKTIFTYSHDNSILAVARNLVDGAAVDGHVWEYNQIVSPEHTSKTRVIKKSAPYGNPPVVASRDFPSPLRQAVQALLLTMHDDPDGAAILRELMIDRFVAPQDEWYVPIKEMADLMKDHAPATP